MLLLPITAASSRGAGLRSTDASWATCRPSPRLESAQAFKHLNVSQSGKTGFPFSFHRGGVPCAQTSHANNFCTSRDVRA